MIGEKKHTIAEVSAETLALEQYLGSLPAGESVTYTEIEMATGVKMDLRGRGLLRTAARRAKRIYTPIRGVGIELSSAGNGSGIVKGRLIKVDNAAKRAETTGAMILDAHGREMTKEDRDQISLTVAVFAAVRVMADQHKRELRRANAKKPPLMIANPGS